MVFGWTVVCLAMAMLNAHAGTVRFGEVVRLFGEVKARDALSGTQRRLVVGDSVYIGEVIEAGEVGEAVLRTDDAGVIAVRPNATFHIVAFKLEPIAESRFDVRIVRGTLRLITGWIGARNKSSYRIQTPTSTIGIRGTDQEPYVMSADMALAAGAKEGTYNKVNSGGVQLQSAGGTLDLVKGQAGFVPARPAGATRGLMTALLPVLLERVPEFYLPGKFDDGLEQFAERELSKALKELPGVMPSAAGALAQMSPDEQKIEATTSPVSGGKPDAACAALPIAKRWLADLDRFIERRSPQSFVDLFTQDVRIVARTRSQNGEVIETGLSREEFIQSTFSSLNQLSAFQSRRTQVSARAMDGASCRQLEVKSTVLENGVMAGRAYQLESQELYELRLERGIWRARYASTTQN